MYSFSLNSSHFWFLVESDVATNKKNKFNNIESSANAKKDHNSRSGNDYKPYSTEEQRYLEIEMAKEGAPQKIQLTLLYLGRGTLQFPLLF